MNIIDEIEREQMKEIQKAIMNDTMKVHLKVVEELGKDTNLEGFVLQNLTDL